MFGAELIQLRPEHRFYKCGSCGAAFLWLHVKPTWATVRQPERTPPLVCACHGTFKELTLEELRKPPMTQEDFEQRNLL